MTKRDAVAMQRPDRQVVPKPLRVLLYAYLIIAGVAGVAALNGYSPLPTTAVLDAWIIAFIAACIVRGSTHRVGLLFLLAFYLATRAVPAVLNDSPIADFLQAYRWLFYLVAFAFAVGRRWGPPAPLRAVTLILIALALAKATLIFAFVGAGERPGLLTENNFEIALFCGLLVAQYRGLSPVQRLASIAMLAVLMVLAESRSGAVAFAVLMVYALSQLRTTTATKVVLGVYALPAVVAIPWFVFAERAGVARIDRLTFLDVFRFETAHWDLLQWLIGTTPITPLSPGSCMDLAYYETLFSSAGNGSCYSVILHAFALRVLFDAGVIGLVLAFLVPWLTMRGAGVSVATSLALLVTAATNSLSVSGLNNPYVALPILLAITLAGSRKAEPGEVPELMSDDRAKAGATRRRRPD